MRPVTPSGATGRYNPAMEQVRCYVESDGRLFVVRRNGRFDLPAREELPFPVEQIGPLATPEPVVFCVPELPAHPASWPSKDDLASDPRASTLLQAAIHGSMPRVVVEGICEADGKLLLVKGNRGYTAGRWTLPGGFLRFGEAPRDGLAREIREELGVCSTIGGLLKATGRLGESSRLHWVMLFYRMTIHSPPRPSPDEIAEADWFPPAEIPKLGLDPHMLDAIETALRPTIR